MGGLSENGGLGGKKKNWKQKSGGQSGKRNKDWKKGSLHRDV